jgi:hypothetical protein
MNSSQAYSCRECGVTYSTARSLNAHEKGRCALSKRGLSELLGQTKSLWEARKRRRIGDSSYRIDAIPAPLPIPSSEDTRATSEPVRCLSTAYHTSTDQLQRVVVPILPANGGELHHVSPPPTPVAEIDNEDLPLAQRRARRIRKKPARFIDNAASDLESGDDDGPPERLLPLDADTRASSTTPWLEDDALRAEVQPSSPALLSSPRGTSISTLRMTFHDSTNLFRARSTISRTSSWHLVDVRGQPILPMASILWSSPSPTRR